MAVDGIQGGNVTPQKSTLNPYEQMLKSYGKQNYVELKKKADEGIQGWANGFHTGQLGNLLNGQCKTAATTSQG